MLKFSPLFVQKIFCFVQIPKSFVQKHKTKTAEAEKNDSNVREKTAASKENNNSVRKTTITASEENDSKIREKHAQKSYGFCTKA